MVRTQEALLGDETPYVTMAKDLGPYRDIVKNKSSLYALLVSSGYLKVASPVEEGVCAVAIPSHEIAQVFVGDIRDKINALKPLVEPFPAFIIEVKRADSDDAGSLRYDSRGQAQCHCAGWRGDRVRFANDAD